MHHDNPPPARVPEFGNSLARCPGREIFRPENPRFFIEMGNDIALVPDMVAGGDHIDADAIEFIADFRRDTEPAGRVFTIHDDEIEVIAFAQHGNMLDHGLAPGPPDHIAAYQNSHRE